MDNVKAGFPIFKNIKDLVYLDSSATALKPQSVIDSETEYYTHYSANVHRGLYPIADRATEEYENARRNVAQFIGAQTEEIIFTSGTTDGINFIAKSLKESGLIKQNPRILLTELEHHSNIVPWQMIGAERIDYIPLNSNLELDLSSGKLDSQSSVDVVAVSLVSNVSGHVADIKRIREMFPDSYLVIDAAQAVSHMEVNVKDLGADLFVFSGHKLYGPTGIGVIYGKEEILKKLIPFKTGGGMIREVSRDKTSFSELPEKFEAGTPNIAGAIGLSSAIDFVKSIGFEEIIAHEKEVKNYALEKLSEINEIKVFHARSQSKNDLSNTHPSPPSREGIESVSVGVISFAHLKIHAHDIAQFLGDRGICIRAGHHCTQILHKDILKVPATARLSLGVYNSKEDIDRFIETLNECLDYYK